jgi:general secretion pathway protein K
MRLQTEFRDALKGSDGGFIIVAVLWILVALATLTSIYAIYVVNTAFAVGANDDKIASEALVTAGVELTAYRLTAVAETDRPTGGEIRFRMRDAAVEVGFRSENSRIDLNVASKELLSNLFVVLGAVRTQADDYADRIIAWRDRPSVGSGDTELSLYRAAGKSYGPRQASFPHPDELWLVLGLPAKLVDRAAPYVTVYGPEPKINVIEAAPAVIAALPGMTPDHLAVVLAAQKASRDNKQSLIQFLGPAQNLVTVEAGKVFRVKVGIRFDDGRQTNSEVVISLVDGAEDPYRILSWRDDLDQAILDKGSK